MRRSSASRDAGRVADLAVGEARAGAVDVFGARGHELAGDVADDLERAPVRVERVVVVARRIGEVAGLLVVVLAQGDDAPQVERRELADEVGVVCVEVAHRRSVAGAGGAPAAGTRHRHPFSR